MGVALIFRSITATSPVTWEGFVVASRTKACPEAPVVIFKAVSHPDPIFMAVEVSLAVSVIPVMLRALVLQVLPPVQAVRVGGIFIAFRVLVPLAPVVTLRVGVRLIPLVVVVKAL